MKSKISDWLQISANIGIVLGLVLVGFQLKQNSDLLKTQLLYEESQRAIALETLVVGENAAEVFARSLTDPTGLSLAEQRIMEALLWSFTEQLRATRMLGQLGLLEEDEWKARVRAETAFFFANDYAAAWWAQYSTGNNALPQDLIDAMNERLDAVDETFYTLDHFDDIMAAIRAKQSKTKP